MKRTIVFLFILLGLMSQCTQKNESRNALREVSLLDESSIKASQVFSKFEFLELNTPEGVYIKQIEKMEESDDFLFFHDSNPQGLNIFYKNGEFFHAFSKLGRGPGEYLSFDDFIVNAEEMKLEVLDKTNRLVFVYDLSTFEFIRSIPLPVSFAFKFQKKGDYYYFQTNGSRNTIKGKATNADVVAFNYKTGETIPLFDRLAPDNQNQFLEFPNIFYKNNTGEIFVSLSWHNEIYKIEGSEVISFLSLDAGNRTIPESILKGTIEDKISYIFSSEGQDKIGGFRLVMQENNKTIIGYGRGAETNPRYWFSLLNPKGAKKELGASRIINDFYGEPLPDVEIFQVIDGKAYSFIYPHQIETSESLLGNKNSSLNNPVLLKFYFE
jgi:hypothetical protein